MSISIDNHPLWLADLDEVLKELPELAELANRTIMVTGATGLICSAIIDLLLRWNKNHKNEIIHVLAAGRSKERFEDRFAPYINDGFLRFVPYDATRENHFDFRCDYIIHGASNTTPGLFISEAVETMIDNFDGMKDLLNYAYQNHVKRALYISSSEVYGRKETARPFSEDEYGYIDLLNPRNSYSVSKRATETLCVSFAAEYGVEAVIVRPGHIYGPTASPKDGRVSSLWAYAAARGEDIVMKSDGAQVRSYCYCLDCASAILKVLLCGENCQAYNISNPESIISIKTMAEIYARTAGVALRMELPTDSEVKSFNPMDNSSLDSTRLLALGWKGMFDAERGFEHTVEVLK